jgi:serine/threonine protein kinase
MGLIRKYEKKNEDEKAPIKEWGKVFFNRKAKYEIACGGSKGVFVFDGDDKVTISIQVIQKDEAKRMIEWNRNNKIKEKLDTIPQKYSKHFNFYDEQFEWEGFLFSKLTLCPKGTLSDLLFGDHYNLEQRLIKELIAALNEAHSVGLIISDLKPENIMLCRCNCLAFIDMDSAIPLPYSDGSIFSTNWWNILSKPVGYVGYNEIERLFKCSDWIAISLVVMLHYAMRLYDPDEVLQDQNNITRRVYSDWKTRDLTYDEIRLLINESDFEKCCNNKGITPGLGNRLGPAAHAVLKSFHYKWKKLPDQSTINKLIEVSTRGRNEAMVRGAVGFNGRDLKL